MSSPKMQDIRVELGCGESKSPGFIGIDRFPLAGVDVVADIDKGIPLADDTVELLLASHFLEHVTDSTRIVAEIYRVCRDRAQVVIIAPYHNQGLNLTNPHHHGIFNEHTPRFWTGSESTVIPREEIEHPHAAAWGLRDSDSARRDFDLRCYGMEFFYFPEYRLLDAGEQRAARQKLGNVCDQIMYHLVVVKRPMADAEQSAIAEKSERFEPTAVIVRKLRESIERVEAENNALRRDRTHLEDRITDLGKDREQLLRAKESAAAEAGRLDQERAALSDKAGRLELENTALQQDRVSLEEQLADIGKDRDRLLLLARERRLSAVELQSRVSAYARRLELSSREAEKYAARIEEGQTRINLLEGIAARQEDLLNRVGTALEAYRKLFRSHRAAPDERGILSESYRQLLDDSFLFTSDLEGCRLAPGPDLNGIPFAGYTLSSPGGTLTGIFLAPTQVAPREDGLLGIEVLTSPQTIARTSTLPLGSIVPFEPAFFAFKPLDVPEGSTLLLRVFARGTVASTRIFEWRKEGFGGFASPRTRAFCGFQVRR